MMRKKYDAEYYRLRYAKRRAEANYVRDFIEHPRFAALGMEMRAMLDEPTPPRSGKKDENICTLPDCTTRHNCAVSRVVGERNNRRVIWYCCQAHRNADAKRWDAA